jgi:hypothetical protein
LRVHHLTEQLLTRWTQIRYRHETQGLAEYAMDTALHELISQRLEDLKVRGAITDYFVAWRGPSGRLNPNVTIWSAASDVQEQLMSEVQWLLGELVPSSEITVIADPTLAD